MQQSIKTQDTIRRAERKCRMDNPDAFDYVFDAMLHYVTTALEKGYIRLVNSAPEDRRINLLHANMNGFIAGYTDTVDPYDSNLNTPIVDDATFDHALAMSCMDHNINQPSKEEAWAVRRYFLNIKEDSPDLDESIIYFAIQGHIAGAIQADKDIANNIVENNAHQELWWQACHNKHIALAKTIAEDMCDEIDHPEANPVILFAREHNLKNTDWFKQTLQQNTEEILIMCAEAVLEKQSRRELPGIDFDDVDVMLAIASAYLTATEILMTRMPLSFPNMPKEIAEAVKLSSNVVINLLKKTGITPDNTALTWAVLASSTTIVEGDNVNWHMDGNSAIGACLALTCAKPNIVNFIPDDLLVEFRKLCD